MIREHNPNWLQIPNHPYRILIVGASASGKTNTSWNLIRQQPDISKIYLYAKDLYEEKYQFTNIKVYILSIIMFLKILLNTGVIWMIFIKILKSTNQIENVKY